MSRKMFVAIALIAALSVFAFAQRTVNSDLQDQLPLESEVQGILGEDWQISEIRSFGSLPPGGLGSGIGDYTDGSNEMTIVLIAFEDSAGAGEIIDAFLESETVAESSDLVESDPEGITEQLLDLTDRILIVSLQSGLTQLVIQIKSLYFYIRVDTIELADLLALADLQLTRIVEFCSSVVEGDAPSYCPEPEPAAEI